MFLFLLRGIRLLLPETTCTNIYGNKYMDTFGQISLILVKHLSFKHSPGTRSKNYNCSSHMLLPFGEENENENALI